MQRGLGSSSFIMRTGTKTRKSKETNVQLCRALIQKQDPTTNMWEKAA
jgi:hypothetical protein